jgi:copper chaperone
MSKTYTFTTNINCGGCVAKVTPFINAVEGIEKWSVDTANPQKILTVQTATEASAQVVDAVKKAGFRIEPLS